MEGIPVTEKAYLFKKLYIENINREPQKSRSFCLQVRVESRFS